MSVATVARLKKPMMRLTTQASRPVFEICPIMMPYLVLDSFSIAVEVAFLLPVSMI